MNIMDFFEFFMQTSFWHTALRSLTPVLFATLATLVAKQAGLYFLGAEGCMTIAALFGVLGSGFTQNLWVGFLAGALAGTIWSLMIGYFSIEFRANFVITSVAFNLAAFGGSEFLLFQLTGDRNSSNSVHSLVFPSVNIPLIDSIPVIGPVLSGQNLLTYLSIVAAFIMFFMLKHTRFGLKIRSVGEMEAAAESVGINVRVIRYKTLALSGFLASLGGMYLSMAWVSRFTTGMVAGRGFISLATQAMAGGNCLLAIGSSGLFAIGNSIAIHLQTFGVDPYLVMLVPYMFIVIIYLIVSTAQLRKSGEKVRVWSGRI